MRNARGFVDDYRRKGYPDDRIRIIASMRPEPLRTEALQILDAESQAPKAPAPAGDEDVGLTTSEQPAVQAEAVTAVFAPPEAKPAEVEAAPVTPSPDVEALRQEAATARGERDKAAADLRKASAELTRTRADLTRLKSDNAELLLLRKHVAELEAALAAKESLLTEREQALTEKEAALALEHAEREAEAGRVEELAATVAKQSGRVKELEALHQQLAGADAELEELRTSAAQLKQGVEAKCEHIAELQTDVSKTRDEAAVLRQQIESNEKAVGDLQDKLSARETELTSLRAHFDREAADLKKRADQEMWIVRRRLRRLRTGALVGSAVAALLVAFFAFDSLSTSRENAHLKDLATATPTHATQTLAVTNPVQAPPAPVHSPANIAKTPAPVAGKPPTISWTLPKVDEPARDNATPPPARAGSTPRPATLNIPVAAPRPAAASKTVTYVVKKNDSLWTISEKVLGKGELWKLIAKQNKISLTDPNVHEGMTLTITLPPSN